MSDTPVELHTPALYENIWECGACIVGDSDEDVGG